MEATGRVDGYCRAFLLRVLVIFSVTAAFLAGYAGAADDEPVIGRVEVQGLRRLTESQVLARARSRAGGIFDQRVASDDAERIAELDEVDWAYYSLERINGQVVLLFVIGEREQIERIIFHGNEAYRGGQLLSQLPFEAGDFLEFIDAQAGERILEDFYREKGYFFAQVELDRERLADGVVHYSIDEGARVRIGQTRFEGNQQISDRRLTSALRDTRKRRWFVLGRNYVEENVDNDIARLHEAYEKQGYLNTHIDAEVNFSQDRSRAFITYHIEEGRRYLVGRISVQGNEFLSDESIIEMMELEPSQTFTNIRAGRDLRSLRSAYLENGFVDVEVDQQRIFVTDQTIDITYDVVEGRRFRIGQINVVGNEQIHDKVVRRVMNERGFMPSQWYNADIARGDGSGYLERLIQRQAMMETATITPGRPDNDKRDAVVRVSEGQTGMIVLGAGVASDSGLIGQVMLEQRNFDITDWPDSFGDFITGKAFRGAGQHLRLTLMPGTQVSEYAISFTEPFLFDRPISLGVDGSSYRRWRESHDEHRLRGRVGLEKRYDDGFRRNINFRLEEVGIRNLDSDAPPEIFEVEGDSTIAGLGYGIGWDTTDFDMSPTTGHRINADYEQVFGDFSFGILTGRYRRWWTVHEDLGGRRTVLGARIRASTIVGDAPPFERFYAGGQGNLRGFAYRGVSRRSGPADDPIGSDWMVVGGSELLVPMPPENLSGLLFVDSGLIDTGGLRLSAGFGVQLELPQLLGPAPIRLELGFPIMKERQDKTRAFSFSMGTLF